MASGFGGIYSIKLSLPQSKALKYGYANARVRGMKGLILNSSLLNDLIKTNSVESMVELLARTNYKNDLVSASLGYTGSQLIELAASKNFARVVQVLLKITPKSDRSFLSALLLKWDLLNLKTIIRAKNLSKDYESVKPNLTQAGGFSEIDFKNILKVDDQNLFSAIMRTEFGKQLATNTQLSKVFQKSFKSVKSFIENESEIDSYIYVLINQLLLDAGATQTANIRKILLKEVDAKNILIIERLKRLNNSKDKIIASVVKGGTFTDSFIARLIEAKDYSALTKLLKGKFTIPNISEVKYDQLVALEIALEKSIASEKLKVFKSETLSAGAIVGFLLLKEEEMHNLRKIAKSKEFGVSEADVREMMVST